MYGREIGAIIHALREETGVAQRQLGKGLCSASKIAKIESGQMIPDHFLLDRLFGRLGKSTAPLEYLLPVGVYRLYELQYRIQTYICRMELKEAENCLEEYERMNQSVQPLHRQFIQKQKAQIAWIRGERPGTVLRLLEAAIKETVPADVPMGVLVKKLAVLDADELKLLLFRWEVSQETEKAESKNELMALMEYAAGHFSDTEEKVKVYPYAVLLCRNIHWEEKERPSVQYHLTQALELLRMEGRILFLPEIIDFYVQSRGKEVPEQTEKLTRQKNVLLKLEKQYGLYFEKYRLFSHIDREFQLDYEMLRRNRIAQGITQEELCGGICTQETLSRIENGTRSSNQNNMNELLKKLKRSGTRVGAGIMTDDYSSILLRRRIEQDLHKARYQEAAEDLKLLQERVDGGLKGNRQYILCIKCIIDFMQGHITPEEAVRTFEQCLALTIKFEPGSESIFDRQLTRRESNLLSQIAIVYYADGNKDIAIRIYERILKNYSRSRMNVVFHIREWSVYMANLAGFLKETGKCEEAIALSGERIRISLEIGKGNELGRSLVDIGGALERRKDSRALEYFMDALLLLDLMKMDVRYQWVVEEIRNSEFLRDMMEPKNITGYICNKLLF